MRLSAEKILVAVLLCMGCSLPARPGHTADPPPVLRITPASAPQFLYRWSADRCEDEFLPDSPARAFRRADGRMVLLTAHRENWSLVGDSFRTLRPTCASILRSSSYSRETDGLLWIQAVYTRDGNTITALISQDMKTVTRAAGCNNQGRTAQCWLNRIVAATSTDMGRSFSLLEANRRVAMSLANEYPSLARGRVGVFTVSNIVERDGQFYIMAWVQNRGSQTSGNCLLRSADPMNPSGWRAWDGTSFSLDLNGSQDGRQCRTISTGRLPTEVRSLSYVTKHNVWVAIVAARQTLTGEDAVEVPGFYYSLSPDLMNWSTPRRLMPAPLRPREEQNDFILSYPSMLDPDSHSRNFDTIDGDRPVLLFTRANLVNGNGSLNRDIQYVYLTIE